ncbi:MAG: ABC-ATPase UvrA [Cryomorphaceae bacterium BACL18 MAG-120924-bin36]|jgi:excinuclease ABC subunit A|nr:MAG: ABC-ATPase UvrA [Cryomorphaceae bacterium BACL18 MAG-120924-bin36]MDP4729713.1 excinuclease ABC subunit UvrA [Schleiferiaceae bacterium]
MKLRILGARAHNLKNIDVELPRRKLVVVTGLSGSGKSSLAFDTLFAEGQRRYMETFSSYARQFLGTMERPDVDRIEGLSPVVAIEQKTTNRNPRSTVGTVTEVYDFLRLLYARTATAYSLATGEEMVSYTDDAILERVVQDFDGQRIALLAPVVRARKGHYRELFEGLAKQGYLKARVNGEWINIDRGLKLDRYKTHDIDVVVDRLSPGVDEAERLKRSIATAMRLGHGSITVVNWDSQDQKHFSRNLMCPTTGLSYPEPEPNSFSFNSPKGACPHCDGLGSVRELSLNKVVLNPRLSLRDGALAPLGTYKASWIFQQLEHIGWRYGYTLETPWKDIPEEGRNAIMHGCNEDFTHTQKAAGISRKISIKYEGLKPFIEAQGREGSKSIQRWADEYLDDGICSHCEGGRLKPESLMFRISGKSIAEVAGIPLYELAAWLEGVHQSLPPAQQRIGGEILKELSTRVGFLNDVGLSYLSLSRSARTLSGGEAQRIRLATQIGSQLVNVLYILDEPSIGLHPRDNDRLIRSLERLRDLGNSVVVVEHDEELMRHADHIVDMGPRAGIHGGRVVAEGTYAELIASNSLTAQYLRGDLRVSEPREPRAGNGKLMRLLGATGRNLQGVDLELPLGKLLVVTGVSGSGKSTLINKTLHPAIAGPLQGLLDKPEPFEKLEGLEHLDKIIAVDQNPIGRNPRSNPSTYTGVFNEIRKLFSELPEAKIRGYAPGRFSFNVKGGRCETCEGGGMRVIEMNFLPDVHVPCETCQGRRFNRETLEVRYKGHSISDVLNMSIEEAMKFFEAVPRIYRVLLTLNSIGLGYITLGQSATTLSGGEAQRIKLATELSKRSTGQTLYLLDEPTTGLHFDDVKVLMDGLHRLVDQGNTVLVIEHNLDVIHQADHIVDLGPDGGAGGGLIVATGTPSEVAASPESITGRYLAEYINRLKR